MATHPRGNILNNAHQRWCAIIRVNIMEETEVKAKAKELLKSYLNKRMRVAISDGRVIDGNFLCTDRDSNIVLGNCEEFSSQEDLGRF